MEMIDAILAQASRLRYRLLCEDELPEWWKSGVAWQGQVPAVYLGCGEPLIYQGHEIGGVALGQGNEILIFDVDRFEIVLAHETAHFCQPWSYSSHGPRFLNQFGHLLVDAGFSIAEVKQELHDCVTQNWWPMAPQWLRCKAIREALKGGDMCRHESGLMRLCAIRQPGWRLALPVTAAICAGPLFSFLGGPLLAAVAVVAATGLLLII